MATKRRTFLCTKSVLCSRQFNVYPLKMPKYTVPSSLFFSPSLSFIGQDIRRPLEADIAEADGSGARESGQGVERPLRGQDKRRPRAAEGRP